MILVPCHRGIGANGALTGFAGGIEAKTKLLALEAKIASAAKQAAQKDSLPGIVANFNRSITHAG